eukprot:892778-Prymnesium_polylepis.1
MSTEERCERHPSTAPCVCKLGQKCDARWIKKPKDEHLPDARLEPTLRYTSPRRVRGVHYVDTAKA